MKKMKIVTLIACIILIGSSHARADLVDFENAGSFGGDDAVVTNNYFSSYGLSVSAYAGSSKATASAATLTFEAVGRDNTDGFWSSKNGRDEAFSGDLGNFFIKAGSGNLSYNKAKYFNMKIDYSKATQAASGEVWDIDGKEQYRVTALDAQGNSISSLTSPVGSLNAEPWTWSFDVSGENNEISSIEVEFVSEKSTLRGFAFDNFNATEANANAVASNLLPPEPTGNSNSGSEASHAAPSQHAAPLPAGFAMGLACMSALFISKKSRQRKKARELEAEDLMAAQA